MVKKMNKIGHNKFWRVLSLLVVFLAAINLYNVYLRWADGAPVGGENILLSVLILLLVVIIGSKNAKQVE